MARVLIIAYTTYSHDRRLRRRAEALAERGDEVDVFCLASLRNAQLNGVNVIRLARPRAHGSIRLGYFRQLRFWTSAALRAARWSLDKRNEVVIVCTRGNAAILCALVPKLLGSRVVLDMDGAMVERYRGKANAREGRLRARLLAIEKIAKADCVIVAHAAHRQRLEQAGIPPHKIRVVLDTPDPRIWRWRQRNDYTPGMPFTIVSYGAMTSSRGDYASDPPLTVAIRGSIASILGADITIHAISLLWHRIPNIRLIVIDGADDYIARAKAAVEFLNLRAHVSFCDHVPSETLRSVLDQAAVGIVANIFGSSRPPELPQELMEYAALGIPSIVARAGAIEHYFSEREVRFYESGNACALADAIEDLYQHSDVRTGLAREARAIASSLGWPQQCQQYFEGIDSLLLNETEVKQRRARFRDWIEPRGNLLRLIRQIPGLWGGFGRSERTAPYFLKLRMLFMKSP
jgi:glycosyltransferase involved in cell wall biosynthesis